MWHWEHRLKDLIPDSCFVLFGTHWWYPPDAFGAQALDQFAVPASKAQPQIVKDKKRRDSAPFHVACTMVLTPARDSGLSLPEPVCSLLMWSLPP